MYPLPAFVYSDYGQIEVLYRIFERKCTFDDVFSLFEDDQVNAKCVSRATQSRFFVNYVTHTSQTKLACTNKDWTITELKCIQLGPM